MNNHPNTVEFATRQGCFDLLEEIERDFDVSINFWLVLQNPPYAGVELWVYASGAGRAFDLLSATEGLGRARVLDAQQGDIYPPLLAVLRQLRHNLRKVWIVKDPRPSL